MFDDTSGHESRLENLPPSPADPPPKGFPTLVFDPAPYEHFLEGTDLTPEQKHEFLETLWHIVVAFVDMGFGIQPADLPPETIPDYPPKNAANTAENLAFSPEIMVELDSQKSTNESFSSASAPAGEAVQKGGKP